MSHDSVAACPERLSPAARVAVVVGNPRPESRTLAAAQHVARELTGDEPGLVVDLATPGLPSWTGQDPQVAALVREVGDADLVVVASPTYKAAYTGLLKLFLDRFAGGTGLRGVAVPVMPGAGLQHALAVEYSLRPLLTELGGTVPVPGLFVLDGAYGDPSAYAAWLDAARGPVRALLEARSLTEVSS